LKPEAKVKRTVTSYLKNMGAYYFYPVTGGYGGSGVPDIIACYEGKFIAIECKAGSNKPTPLQEKNIRDIKNCEGLALVINEESMHTVVDKIVRFTAKVESKEIDMNNIYKMMQ
jgi:hypothetical protein|tara:strand:+ start:232 stop:573 length:342 start_codon:yes stop_codon:yes gene_type:complete